VQWPQAKPSRALRSAAAPALTSQLHSLKS
jgi:hypothetical protein